MKTVLVDIDGTLLDSQARKDQFYTLAIDKLNAKFRGIYSFSLHKFFKSRDSVFHSYPDGRRNDPTFIISAFLEDCNISQEIYDETLNELLDLYWEILGKSVPIPNAAEFLYALVQNGFRFILYSDGTTRETDFKLKLFPDAFFPSPFITVVSDSRSCQNDTIIPLGMNKTVEAYRFLENRYDVVGVVGDSEDFDIIPAIKAGLKAFNVKQWAFNKILKEISKIKCKRS